MLPKQEVLTPLFPLCGADVDPAVLQRLLLVDLLLRRGRVPGGEDLRGDQVPRLLLLLLLLLLQ